MPNPRRLPTAAAVVLAAGVALTGCSSQADTVSSNLSNDADSFKIYRQIVFYNGITDKYVSEVDGYCSIGNDTTASQMSYTCKVGPDRYIKNFLKPSDNLTWFSLQTVPATSDPYHFKVIFRPETIVPDVDFQSSNSN